MDLTTARATLARLVNSGALLHDDERAAVAFALGALPEPPLTYDSGLASCTEDCNPGTCGTSHAVEIGGEDPTGAWCERQSAKPAPVTCGYCDRVIVKTPEGGWIDPEAPATPEDGDDHIWRETCDRSPLFDARHDPN